MSKRIFIGAAKDTIEGTEALRSLSAEITSIKVALKSIYNAEVEVAENLDFGKIDFAFQTSGDSFEVFHFAGHANSFGLLMQDSEGKPNQPNVTSLAQYLALFKNLQLVFLNACSTYKQAEELAKMGIPYVIATSQEVYDTVAKEFAVKFYEHYLNWRKEPDGVERAFEAARSFIKNDKSANDPKRIFRSLGEENDTPEIDDAWKILTGTPKAIKPKKEFPPLYLEIDRETQFTSLRGFEVLPVAKPQICLLLGDEDSMHYSLVRRFYNFLSSENKPIKPYGFRNQPQIPIIYPSTGAWHLLLKDVFEAFSIPATQQSANAAGILQALPPNTISYCQVDINLKEEDWKKTDHVGILKKFVNEFWDVPMSVPGSRLFVFLNFFVPKSFERNKKSAGFLGFFSKKEKIDEVLDELENWQATKESMLDILSKIPISDIKISLDRIGQTFGLAYNEFEDAFRESELFTMREVEQKIGGKLKALAEK